MKVFDYNISNCGDSSNFYIGDVYDVLTNVVGLRDGIVSNANSGELGSYLKLNDANDSCLKDISVCENGMVMTVTNTIPSDANKYDDFSSARLYLFDNGEIHYILSVCDNRFNKEGKVDEETISKLDSMLGKIVGLKEKKSFASRAFSSTNDSISVIENKVDSLLTKVNDLLLEYRKNGRSR